METGTRMRPRGRLGRAPLLLFGLVALTSLAVFGCDDDDDDDNGGAAPAATTAPAATSAPSGGGATQPTAAPAPTEAASLSGAVEIDGSSTVFPITEAVAEEFRGAEGDVQVTVGVSGTGGGFERFCAGETDISDASRPISQTDEDEVPVCTANNIEYIEIPVAYDGLSVVVHPDNDWLTCITVEELNKMWAPEAEGVVTQWSDVNPAWPAEDIKLFGPGTDSGTFDYFTGAINGDEGASRADYTPSEDDNVLVQGVAGDKYALGYFGLAYLEENLGSIKGVQVDGGGGCVEPTAATVESGEYAPLSRPLFIYVNKEAADTKPQVAAFVDYYLENVAVLSADVGYVRFPDAFYEVIT
jgi:phosphate transport system substrate-binding protein